MPPSPSQPHGVSKMGLDSSGPVAVPRPDMTLSSMRNTSRDGTSASAVRWNTANLGLRLGADLTGAVSASALVAPVICVIDQSIVSKAATGLPFSVLFRRSARSLLQPHRFLVSRPFLLIFSLYFSTYATANAIDTASSALRNKPAATVSAGPTKFVATSAVNMSLCVYKDSCFARMFGSGGSAAAAAASTVPRLSYALFAVRDSLTIFASFNIPPLLAPQLTRLPEPVKQRFHRILGSEAGRANAAQFLAPAAVQLVSTPIHLLGLDLYNRQGRLGAADRWRRIVRDWTVSAFARMGRIIPAFGVGGVVNANVRRNLMGRIEGAS